MEKDKSGNIVLIPFCDTKLQSNKFNKQNIQPPKKTAE